MSSVYWPAPVRKRLSSRRSSGLPSGFDMSVMAVSSGSHGAGLLARLAELDRLHDVVIAGAAAQVAFEPGADLGFAGSRLVLEDLHRGHHHARRAEAALQAVALAEGRLHRMQLAVRRKA